MTVSIAGNDEAASTGAVEQAKSRRCIVAGRLPSTGARGVGRNRLR